VFKHLTYVTIWEGQLLQSHTKFFDHLKVTDLYSWKLLPINIHLKNISTAD